MDYQQHFAQSVASSADPNNLMAHHHLSSPTVNGGMINGNGMNHQQPAVFSVTPCSPLQQNHHQGIGHFSPPHLNLATGSNTGVATGMHLPQPHFDLSGAVVNGGSTDPMIYPIGQTTGQFHHGSADAGGICLDGLHGQATMNSTVTPSGGGGPAYMVLNHQAPNLNHQHSAFLTNGQVIVGAPSAICTPANQSSCMLVQQQPPFMDESASPSNTGKPEEEEAGQVNGMGGGGPASYDELFPSLSAPSGGGSAANSWSQLHNKKVAVSNGGVHQSKKKNGQPLVQGKGMGNGFMTAVNGGNGSKNGVMDHRNGSTRPIKSNTITKKLQIPSGMRKQNASFTSSHDGGGGASLHLNGAVGQIKNETGVTSIDMCVSKVDNSLTILIVGKADGVEKAATQLQALYQQPISRNIRVAVEYHSVIIGKGGKRLKSIEQSTGTRISMPSSNSNNKFKGGSVGVVENETEEENGSSSSNANEVISITGPPHGVEKAFIQLKSISDQQSKYLREFIDVPVQYHAFIQQPSPHMNFILEDKVNSAKTGKLVLYEKNEVRIHIPPTGVINAAAAAAAVTTNGNSDGLANPPNSTNPSSLLIKVDGEKEAVISVTQRIKQVLQDMKHKFSEVVVEVKKCQHRLIVGYKYSTIREIMSQYGVSVEMPPLDSTSGTITLRGPQDKLGIALSKVYEKANSIVDYEISCPSWLFKYIIGKKGTSLQKFHREKVQIKFDENSNKVLISGPNTSSTTPSENGSTSDTEEVRNLLQSTVNTLLSEMDCQPLFGNFSASQKSASKGSNVGLTAKNKGGKVPVGAALETTTSKVDLDKVLKELTATGSSATSGNVNTSGGKHRAVLNRIRRSYDVMINLGQQSTASDFGTQDSTAPLSSFTIEGKREDVEKARLEFDALVTKISTEKARDVTVESRFHSLLIGHKGENMKQLRADFPEVQIEFPNVGSKSDVISIVGDSQQVDTVAKLLIKSYKSLQESNYQQRVPVFREFHKFVVGKGGATIKKIRSETNTKIDLPDTDSRSDMILVTGRKEDVLKGVEMIEKIQNEMSNVVDEKINIPCNIHNSMIGAKGRLIQSILDQCGAGLHIKFPEKSENSDLVELRGAKEDVLKAKKLLQEIVDDRNVNCVTDIVHANVNHHKFLIGKNGVYVQMLRESTGARVIFPPSNHSHQTADSSVADKDLTSITIIGTQEAVDKAKSELNERIKKLSEIIEDVITIPIEYHKHFVSRRGEVIKSLSDAFGGVTISFPRLGVNSDQVTVKGSAECVNSVKEKMNEIVSDLQSQVCEYVNIDASHHGALVGPRGVRIQQICKNFNVQINFPDRNNNVTLADDDSNTKKEMTEEVESQDIVKHDDQREGDEDVNNNNNNSTEIVIKGKKEDCEKAKQALIDLIPVVEKFEIPVEFHRFIIGSKGAGIKQLVSEHDVIGLRVPKMAENCSTIEVEGSQANVNSCIEALKARVEELEGEKEDREARNHHLKFKVEKEYHVKIIGKGGSLINSLRKEHNVQILIPSVIMDDVKEKADHDSTEMVTIIGYESDCERCQKSIETLIKKWKDMAKEEIHVDVKYHPMIIGRKGLGLAKIMKNFQVEIKMPRRGGTSDDSEEEGVRKGVILITGESEDNVLDCKDHILNLVEEFQTVMEERNWKNEFTKSQLNQSTPHHLKGGKNGGSNGGFFGGRGAPWENGTVEGGKIVTNSDDSMFPNLNSGGGETDGPSSSSMVSTTDNHPTWGVNSLKGTWVGGHHQGGRKLHNANI